MRTNKHVEVDEDDDIYEHQFNKENYDRHHNDKIDEEEDNSN